ncbi:UDP-2,4-diacetamido-2,4,6-trideoxy-beta-L-altropyranose hydrolase [Chloroflexota bacterium]
MVEDQPACAAKGFALNMHFSNEQPLIIRADAIGQMGTGHVMRCFALAQAWLNTVGDVIFLTACHSQALLERLRESKFNVHVIDHPYPDDRDWDSAKSILTEYPNAWVVLDGYHLDEVYQKRVKEAGNRVLVIDDTAHLQHYHADIILNQNLHAEHLPYSHEPDTKLLLGTCYTLLRKEFHPWANWERQVSEVAHHVLVSFGGTDTENQTLKVVRALQEMDTLTFEAVVVVGTSNPHIHEIETLVRESRVPIQLIQDADDMAELMAWADVAITSAGTTTWELAFMGLPALVIATAENQTDVAVEAERLGAAQNLGWYYGLSEFEISEALRVLFLDSQRRQMMSKQGRTAVDGHGAGRVCSALAENGLYLRSASRIDCQLLWRWANDPLTRSMSINTDPIDFKDHLSWFEKKLKSEDATIMILERDSAPVGQIRFDLDVLGCAEIDVYIAEPYRGLSLGTYLLNEGARRYFLISGERVKSLIGHVRTDNLASRRAFEGAGFGFEGNEVLQDVSLMRYVRSKGGS